MIMERKFQPVIVFSFSRRECEQHAMSMSKLDFNTQEEKVVVDEVFNNAIQCLNEEDRSLPAIELMLPLLQRGIAVHHSGLLPVIKELVELLFQEGLVKALFATETVSLTLSINLVAWQRGTVFSRLHPFFPLPFLLARRLMLLCSPFHSYIMHERLIIIYNIVENPTD